MGCRIRTAKSDLLRVVAVEGRLVPDPRGRMPGRGAHLHPDLSCLVLAERRRAFPRALRLPGPLDAAVVREHLEQQAANHRRSGWPRTALQGTTQTPGGGQPMSAR